MTSPEAPSKLRRGGKHCPICLASLAPNAHRTRKMRGCAACGACPQPDKTCARCRATLGAVWESKAGAACATCGAHGDKRAVIAAIPG